MEKKVRMKFKKGDRVRIRRDSQFSRQSGGIGIVGDSENEDSDWITVKFPTHHNVYREKDLESTTINWKEKLQ